MGTFLLIVLGILLYAFLARIVYNIFPRFFWKDEFNKEYGSCGELRKHRGSEQTYFVVSSGRSGDRRGTAALFPIVIPGILLFHLGKTLIKLPLKLADFVTDPTKYKFRIKLERSK